MYLKDSDLDDYEVGNWYPVDNKGFLIKENLQVIGKKINGDSPQKDQLIIGDKQITLTEYQIIANQSAKKANQLQQTVDRQSTLISNLNTQITNVNNVVDTINIQIGEADLPALEQSIIDLNEATATLQETLNDIGPATATENGLMSAADKIKLNGLQNYSVATETNNGLMSASDKAKLDLITVANTIDLDNLEARISALEPQ